MSLLRTPPSDLTDISQILEFARDNQKILSEIYRVDNDLEIKKYRKFFTRMERVVLRVGKGTEGAEDHLQEFNTKLMARIEAAKNGRDTAVNKDIVWLHNDFKNQSLCLIKMVGFMASELQNAKSVVKETNKGKMGDENRNSYDTREHNNVTPKFQSRFPEIHKSEAGTDHGMGIEVAEDALNLSSEDETTGNALGGDLDLQFHHLEGGQGYGPALNEEQKEKNGSDEKDEGWNMPQPPLTADNGTNNGENDPKQQLSENQKLNFAGGFAPSINLGTNPLLMAEVETTLKEIKRRHGNSNTNNITLETLNNIKKERDSSDAPCRDGHAKTVGTTRNDPGASRPSDFQRSNGGVSLTEGIQLRTLEDSLKHFGFFGRLEDLEKSLEEMRRGKKTAEEHQEECKRLDKELQQLSRKYHPDSVMRDGGSQREVTRAKEMQTALNATRTVLKTLSRIFVEDKDIDYRYAFFTRLQLGLLGNEDQVEDHVFQVLFKISLVSEIKQTIIIFEIRNILVHGSRCIERFLEKNDSAFVSFRDIVVFHLRRCVAGYKKLQLELQEVVSECKDERLHNILPTLTQMKRDCGVQLRHFEALLEMSKRSSGNIFPMYSSCLPVDEYYVLPVISYFNVIFACNAMIRASAKTIAACAQFPVSMPSVNFMSSVRSWWDNLKIWNFAVDGIGDPNTVDPDFEHTTTKREFEHVTVDSKHVDIKEEDEVAYKIERLYELAFAYRGDKRCKAEVKKKYRWRSMDRDVVETIFHESLKEVRVYLESKFRTENYVEGQTNKHILQACKEMMSEFREKASEVARGLEVINKQNELGRQQLEEVQMNNELLANQIRQCRENNKIFFNQIQELRTERSRNSRINFS